MSKEHAEHNKKLCDLLISNKGFNDWVVTTAFYSSLHFVQSKIFPFKSNNTTFNNFDHYYSTFKTIPKPSRHVITALLVASKLRDISSEYRWLLDTCKTARYHNYKISDSLANRAKNYLDKIKSHC